MIPSIRSIAAALLSAAALLPLAAVADEVPSPKVLVATVVGKEAFGEAVILVVPLSNGAHYGFVLNRPTETTLAELMPEDKASQSVSSHVHLGGPQFATGLFAVVREPRAVSNTPRRITADLSVAIESDEVDRVIAQHPGDARFFMGLVIWNAGELEDQVRAGAWRVMAPEAGLVMSTHPDRLWTRLIERAALRDT